jgi:Peptidase family C50
MEEGPNFDGRSSIYEYLTAKCPCVIGCLWTVTDGDIDRFFMALVNSCFSQLAAAAASTTVPDATPLTRAKSKRMASAAKKPADGLSERLEWIGWDGWSN